MNDTLIQTGRFSIRPVPAAAAGLDQILAVYRQCEDFLSLGPVPLASLEMVEADLAHSQAEGGCFCTIYDPTGQQIFGIVDFIAAGFEGDPGTAFLSLLMIAAPFRGQGLGAAVVEAVEAWICANYPVRSIRAGVQVNNPAAIRFWKRMGYTVISGAEQMPDGTVAYQLDKPVIPIPHPAGCI